MQLLPAYHSKNSNCVLKETIIANQEPENCDLVKLSLPFKRLKASLLALCPPCLHTQSAGYTKAK